MFSIREARGRDGPIVFKYHFVLATQNVNPYLISTHQNTASLSAFTREKVKDSHAVLKGSEPQEKVQTEN